MHQMAVSHCRTVSHHRILEKIGAGGMGEVYRATDSRLGRSVAVKILAEDIAADQTSMPRFEREARVLAALNHPNIATIYGLEVSEETRGLVMERVEDPTLADRMAQHPVLMEEPSRLRARSLKVWSYAHARGIIHRDLKPSNIKLTSEGRVKNKSARGSVGKRPQEHNR